MTAAYGTWKSPITSDLIVAEMIGVGSPILAAGATYWLEARPREAGRNVIVRRDASGQVQDMTPPPFNVRSRVHEYGGGSWWLDGGDIYFCHFADQQIYVVGNNPEDQPSPRQLTHAPSLRFADGIMDHQRQRLVCIVEDHSIEGQEAQNYLAAVNLADGAVNVLHRGHDFYASPTLSPDGTHLAWITWDHPNMPWDGTELWQASVTSHGTLLPVKITGSRTEAIQQPRYASSGPHKGTLHFISDRSGWWNLYRLQVSGPAQNLWPLAAEFGVPQWNFGPSNYQFVGQDILCCYSSNCTSQLALLHPNGRHTVIGQPYTDIGGIHASADGRRCAFIGASATSFSAVIELDLATGSQQRLKASCDLVLDPGYYSQPQAITYATGPGPGNTEGEVAHGFYYPPTNKDFTAPPDSAPPLVVELHGGPTSATYSGLNLRKQFWTSRGFAVLDVNYRGSSGYGRAYRDKLQRQWGIVDVDDTVYGAQYLVDQGLADPQRLAIKGGSAGGYTTLAALALRNTFKAGASYYGVGDLEALAKDTHKFEARYLDGLIGAYPQEMQVYKDRSPISHIDQLTCPVIFFQGLEDKVVPPNQAEAMVAALDRKGIAVAYVTFAEEQHGFRQAANIKRALDLELFFYGRVFGFTPADPIEPITILNLPN